jgi:hypothetical protein
LAKARAARKIHARSFLNQNMDIAFLLAVGASFIAAGFVKGVVGLGLPTVAMGTLSLVMAPVQAAALLIVPSMVTNVWQLAAGPGLRALLLRRLWRCWPPSWPALWRAARCRRTAAPGLSSPWAWR